MKKTSPYNQQIPKIHPIQWDILKRLSISIGLRFNQIKDKELDPQQFVYHLKKLVSMNLVAYDNNSKLYHLDEGGKVLLNSFKDIPSFQELKIDTFITLYIKRNEKILTVTRGRHPQFGKVGTPSFNVDPSMSIKDNGDKAFKSLGFTGDIYLPIMEETIYLSPDNEVIRHTNMFTFYSPNPEGNPIPNNDEGVLAWMTIEEITSTDNYYDDIHILTDFFNSTPMSEMQNGSMRIVTREDRCSGI